MSLSVPQKKPTLIVTPQDDLRVTEPVDVVVDKFCAIVLFVVTLPWDEVPKKVFGLHTAYEQTFRNVPANPSLFDCFLAPFDKIGF